MTTRPVAPQTTATTPATTAPTRTTQVVKLPSTFGLGNFFLVVPLRPGAVVLEDLKAAHVGPGTTVTVGARSLPRSSAARAVDLSGDGSGPAWVEYTLPPGSGRFDATMGFVRETPARLGGVVSFTVDGVPSGKSEFLSGQQFQVTVPFRLQPVKILRITVVVPYDQHVAIIGGQVSPIDKDVVFATMQTKIIF